MSKVRVANFAISIDGYSSAPGQTREEPFGPSGLRVMEWFFPTDTFRKMQKKSGETGVDNDFSARSMTGMGAWILGRNMLAHPRPLARRQLEGMVGEDPPVPCPDLRPDPSPPSADHDEGGNGLPLRHRAGSTRRSAWLERPPARRTSGSAVAPRPVRPVPPGRTGGRDAPGPVTRSPWRWRLDTSPGPTSMGWGTSAWSESPESGRQHLTIRKRP